MGNRDSQLQPKKDQIVVLFFEVSTTTDISDTMLSLAGSNSIIHLYSGKTMYMQAEDFLLCVLKFVTPDSRVRVVLSLRSGLVLSLVVCGGVGPSTASLANQAPVYCGCPAGTHGCDLVSRVTRSECQPCCCVVGSRVACS